MKIYFGLELELDKDPIELSGYVDTELREKMLSDLQCCKCKRFGASPVIVELQRLNYDDGNAIHSSSTLFKKAERSLELHFRGPYCEECYDEEVNYEEMTIEEDLRLPMSIIASKA